jgi:hypothetical protein
MPGRKVTLVALQVLLCAAVQAAELPSELRPLFDGFTANRRVALGYVRSQNGDLSAVAIERLRERLLADRGRLSPATLADAELAAALTRTEGFIDDGLKLVEIGRFDRATRFLNYAAEPLALWRRSKRIRLFSDCIAEISKAWEALEPYRRTEPSLADGVAVSRIVFHANLVASAVGRCDREADEKLRAEPEFRRLIDGMLSSLKQVPDAVAAHDSAWLHRLLIEQRSFEQLLTFRFG